MKETKKGTETVIRLETAKSKIGKKRTYKMWRSRKTNK